MNRILPIISLILLPFLTFSQKLIWISPNSANAGQTLNITITGVNTHFNNSDYTFLEFGFNQGSSSIIVNSINAISPTNLIANITVPKNTYTCDYDISIYNSIDGYLPLSKGFHVNGVTPPSITVSPKSANAGQTLTVTITGNNTHFNQGSTTMLNFGFNQGSGTTIINSINSISPTTLIANITIPNNTYTGDYDISTYNSTDGNLSLSNGFHVNGITPPAISSVTPNSANAGQTLTLTITGTNTHFNQGSATMLEFGFNQGSGTTIVNSINVTSPTTIVANITVPNNTYTGDYDIQTYNSTDGYLSLSNGFHVNGVSPPAISSVTPNSANAGQTLTLTITGTNTHFNQGSATMLEFGFNQGSGTTVVNSINATSPTTLIANITVPNNTFTGDYDISTYNSTDGYLTLSKGFHVNGVTPPAIASVTPNSANAGQTLTLTITGTNTHFNQGSATMLEFGFNQGSGTSIVNSINATSPTTLVANITVPKNTYTGDYDISTFNYTDGYLSLSKGFHVNGLTPPALASVTPNSADAGQTLTLTITGTNTHFNQGSETMLEFGFNQGSGTTVVNSINATSPTTLIANITVPNNTFTGDYDISTYNSTDGYLTLSKGFHVNGVTPPAIASVTPNSANAGQTLTLTITGTNTHFNQGSGTSLKFGFNQGSGTTIINSINATSPTTLIATITVPKNIASGGYYIEVENSIDGSLFLDNGFYVTGNSKMIGYVIPTNESEPGLCDGKAKVVVNGGVLPYTYKYSNGQETSNATGMCPGLYTLSVIDSQQDTLNLNYIISSKSNTYITNNYNNSSVVDSLYTPIISNCTIDYTQISSISVSNFKILPNNKISVNWAIIYSGNKIEITQSYDLSGKTGVYLISLQLYCPHKTIDQYLTAYDKIYYDAASVGLNKIESFNLAIYPNPFSDHIIIAIDNNESAEVLITDISGKEVVNRKFNDKLIKIDMSALSSGSYIVTVRNNNSVTTKQIVK